jgi:hypothetical protein
MAKKDAEQLDAPPIPGLSLDPASEPIETLPGPAAPDAAEPEERKRRRRRKKAEPETPVPAEGAVTAEDVARCEAALAATFEILSKVVAKRRGAHWILDQEEAGTLGRTWTVALAPYLPKIGAAVPWAAALAVTWSMVQPRLEQDRELTGPAPVPAGPVLARE